MNELTKRIIFGLIYVLLVVFATTFNSYTFFGLIFIFMLFSIYEFNKMIKLKSVIPYLLGITFFITSYIITHQNSSETNIKLIGIKNIANLIGLLLIFNVFIIALLSKKIIPTVYIGKTMMSFFYTVLPFILLLRIPFYKGSFDNKIILGIFILIWVNDTFAYLIGKQFGKTKLFERISPKKTIEGFVGGVIFTLITSYILSIYFTNTSLIYWFIIALIISAFGVIGDLVESMFKRQVNIKDSSNLIPGHGGFLDRLDSIIFVAPYIFIFLYLTNYLNLL